MVANSAQKSSHYDYRSLKEIIVEEKAVLAFLLLQLHQKRRQEELQKTEESNNLLRISPNIRRHHPTIVIDMHLVILTNAKNLKDFNIDRRPATIIAKDLTPQERIKHTVFHKEKMAGKEMHFIKAIEQKIPYQWGNGAKSIIFSNGTTNSRGTAYMNIVLDPKEQIDMGHMVKVNNYNEIKTELQALRE
uniref:Uncharacterized protein n=1 Tax=Romanomermis culicivorax TaxID=13658 RepID=A0A915JBW6_ROMCU